MDVDCDERNYPNLNKIRNDLQSEDVLINYLPLNFDENGLLPDIIVNPQYIVTQPQS